MAFNLECRRLDELFIAQRLCQVPGENKKMTKQLLVLRMEWYLHANSVSISAGVKIANYLLG